MLILTVLIVIGICMYFLYIILHSTEYIFLYFKQNVLYWPDDDHLRSKHVATV